MNKYKVSMSSKSGFYAQYSGDVTVMAENDDDAIEQAFLKLKRGAFPDRSRDMWRVKGVTRVFN